MCSMRIFLYLRCDLLESWRKIGYGLFICHTLFSVGKINDTGIEDSVLFQHFSHREIALMGVNSNGRVLLTYRFIDNILNDLCLAL